MHSRRKRISSDTNNSDYLNSSEFSFKNSNRKVRRETADPVDMDDLLKSLNDSTSSTGVNAYFNFGTKEQIVQLSASKRGKKNSAMSDISSTPRSHAPFSSSKPSIFFSESKPSTHSIGADIDFMNDSLNIKLRKTENSQHISNSTISTLELLNFSDASHVKPPSSSIHRRETIDSLDLEALQTDHLNNSGESFQLSDRSSFPCINNPNASFVSSISSEGDLSNSKRSFSSDHTYPILEISKVRICAKKLDDNNRRQTAEPSDLENLLQIAEESPEINPPKYVRRETAAYADINTMLNLTVETTSTANMSDSPDNVRKRNKNPHNCKARESVNTVALYESVENILKNENSRSPGVSPKSFCRHSTFSISPLPAHKKLSPENAHNRDVYLDEASIGGETAATVNSFTLSTATRSANSNLDATHSIDSSNGSIATIDVIASIEELLAPCKDDVHLSDGKRAKSTRRSAKKRVTNPQLQHSKDLQPVKDSVLHASPSHLPLRRSTRASALSSLNNNNSFNSSFEPVADNAYKTRSQLVGLPFTEPEAVMPPPPPSTRSAAKLPNMCALKPSNSRIAATATEVSLPFTSPSERVNSLASVLKSCLKSSQKIDSSDINNESQTSTRRNVIFGSPRVAEFNIKSPTYKLTPMCMEKAKQLYSMDGKSYNNNLDNQATACSIVEDPETVENSRILDEWDRLTVASEELGESGSDQGSVFSPVISESDRSYSSAGGVSRNASNKRYPRRKSIMNSVRPRSSGYGVDDKRVEYAAAHAQPGAQLQRQEQLELQSLCPSVMEFSNISDTVELPSTLKDLIAYAASSDSDSKESSKGASDSPHNNYQSSVNVSVQDVTEKLEFNLHSLLQSLGHQYTHSVTFHTPQTLSSHSNSVQSEHSLRSMIGLPQDTSFNSSELDVRDTTLQSMIAIQVGDYEFNLGDVTANLNCNRGSDDADKSTEEALQVHNQLDIVNVQSNDQSIISIQNIETGEGANSFDDISFDGGATVELETHLVQLVSDLQRQSTQITQGNKTCIELKRSPKHKGLPRVSLLESSSAEIGSNKSLSGRDDIDDMTETLEADLFEMINRVAQAQQRQNPLHSTQKRSLETVQQQENKQKKSPVIFAQQQIIDAETCFETENLDVDYACPGPKYDDTDTTIQLETHRDAHHSSVPETTMETASSPFSTANVHAEATATPPDFSAVEATASVVALRTRQKTAPISSMASTILIPVETNNLMSRLKALNANARRNSLAQCATPLVAMSGDARGMSVGTKKHSLNMLTSAQKVPYDNGNKRLRSETAENTHPNPSQRPVLLPANQLHSQPKPSVNPISQLPVTEIQPNTPAIPILAETISLQQLYEHINLAQLQLAHTAHRLPSLAISAVSSSKLSSTTRAKLETAFIEVFQSAISECNKSLEVIKNQDELLFKLVPISVHKLVAVTFESGDESTSSRRNLFTLASNTVDSVQQTMSVWEQYLASSAITKVDSLIQVQSAILRERSELEAEASRQVSDELTSLRDRVAQLHLRINAQDSDLAAVKAEISDLLESRTKDIARVMDSASVINLVHVDTAVTGIPVACTVEERIIQGVSIVQLTEKKLVELTEIQKTINIINKLSYCRVNCYNPDLIVLDVILSPNAKVSISFVIVTESESESASTLEYAIGDIQVELLLSTDASTKILNRSPGSAHKYAQSVAEREKLLSAAFFATVMCSEDVWGPLSARCLRRVTHPCHIPDLMHKVTGYVTALRRVFDRLEKDYFTNECTWTVKQQGLVQVTRMAASGSECAQCSSVRNLVSGDWNSLGIEC